MSTLDRNHIDRGIDNVYRDLILGHSLQGIDDHYKSPSEYDLHRAMARYTEWIGGKSISARVDLNVDLKKGSQLELTL